MATKPQGTFYHSSRIKLPIGTKLKPLRRLQFKGMERRQIKTEEIFERIRGIEFPSRPSRLESIFVVSSPEDSILPGFLYETRVNGKTFLTDGELYCQAQSFSNQYEIEEIAREYWSGGETTIRNPEILVGGEVTILKLVE